MTLSLFYGKSFRLKEYKRKTVVTFFLRHKVALYNGVTNKNSLKVFFMVFLRKETPISLILRMSNLCIVVSSIHHISDQK